MKKKFTVRLAQSEMKFVRRAARRSGMPPARWLATSIRETFFGEGCLDAADSATSTSSAGETRPLSSQAGV